MHIQLELQKTSVRYSDSNHKSCSFCEPNQFYPVDIDLGFEISVDPTNCWHREEIQRIDKRQQTELYSIYFNPSSFCGTIFPVPNKHIMSVNSSYYHFIKIARKIECNAMINSSYYHFIKIARKIECNAMR